nr:DUF4160 domain-containing protein [uncultured Paraglaciecola sp.]
MESTYAYGFKNWSLRFFFYSNENGEPAHIHIQRENMFAKF